MYTPTSVKYSPEHTYCQPTLDECLARKPTVLEVISGVFSRSCRLCVFCDYAPDVTNFEWVVKKVGILASYKTRKQT